MKKSIQRVNQNTAIVWAERENKGRMTVIPVEAFAGDKKGCDEFVKNVKK